MRINEKRTLRYFNQLIFCIFYYIVNMDATQFVISEEYTAQISE